MQNTLLFSSLNDAVQSKFKEIISRFFGQESVQSISERCKLYRIDKAGLLVRQGDEAKSMYLLLEGAMIVFVEKEGKQLEINNIQAGEAFGEMALLQSEKRSASVLARRNSVVLEILDTEFHRMSAEIPQLNLKLSMHLAERLRQSNIGRSKAQNKNSIIHLRSISESSTAEYWAHALENYWGHDKIIKSLQIEDNGPLWEELISHGESCDLLLLYSSKPELQLLLENHADKTVYLGDSTNKVVDLENVIRKSEEFEVHKKQLILSFAKGEKPIAESWLKLFDPGEIFRIEKGNTAHRERACRAISEELICLVLGGGGAHGLSAVGVLKALNEQGIPIDVIGGTSIGSIMSAAIANDWTFEYIREHVKLDISDHNPLSDYTLPFVALLRGRRLKKVLKKYFDHDMVNCWKNCFLIAANLSKSSTEILEKGPMDLSVAASISIPGILPPTLHKNSLLVDGGVVNNLPADIMAQKYPGRIITVDVVSQKKKEIKQKYQVGNTLLFKRMLGLSKSQYVPGLMNTVMKSITLSSAEATPQKIAVSDIYLSPRTKKAFLAWKAFDAFVSEGYSHSMEQLKDLDKTEVLGLPRQHTNA